MSDKKNKYKNQFKKFFVKQEEDVQLSPLTNPDNPENLVKSDTGIENLENNVFLEYSNSTDQIVDEPEMSLVDEPEMSLVDEPEMSLDNEPEEDNSIFIQEEPILPKRPEFVPLTEDINYDKEELSETVSEEKINSKFEQYQDNEEQEPVKLSKKEELLRSLKLSKKEKVKGPKEKVYTVEDLSDNFNIEENSLDAHNISLKPEERVNVKELDKDQGSVYRKIDNINETYFKASYWGLILSVCIFVLIAAFYGYDYIAAILDPTNNLSNGASYIYPYQESLSYTVAQFIWIISGFFSVVLVFYSLARSFSCIISGVLLKRVDNIIISLFYLVIFMLGFILISYYDIIEAFVITSLLLILLAIVIRLFNLKT